MVRYWALKSRSVIFRCRLRSVAGPNGTRTLERRVTILGVPISVRRSPKARFRVGLLVDEFFGGWDTPIGGYGALARKYICKYIPNDQIDVDLILDTSGGKTVQQKTVDQTVIYRLPSHPITRQTWFDEQDYDLFLSIELTEPSFNILSGCKTDVRLLYWIQDPRDLEMYQPRSRSVVRLRDDDWAYIAAVSTWMQKMIAAKRVAFISQGASLSAIARKMFAIPESMPIQDLPNPVEIDFTYTLNQPEKEEKVVFLGRLEAQKRVWIVCEIAKKMPNYQFYILGATGRGREEAANANALRSYRNDDGSSKIPNLHFTGHVDGEVKSYHLKTAKILLNTSIWEGIPVSWLEALSFGTLIVSAFDRDDIVSRFGTFVGEVMGDGTDDEALDRFRAAVEQWMSNDAERNALAQDAIEFVRGRHNIQSFTENMRGAILHEIAKAS